MKYSAIIVEDEIPSAQRLSRLLEAKDFAVLAVLQSVGAAKEYLSRNAHPDWLFLDIELRDGSVFELLKSLTPNSRVIFTTAYADKALEAFQYGALDYLLKPIDVAGLEATLAKLENVTRLIAPVKVEAEKSFLVSTGKVLRKISVSAISHFSSADNLTMLHSGSRVYVIGKSLEKLTAELPAHAFFRISRSAIVNRSFIVSVNADAICLLDVDGELALSRNRSKDFKTWFRTEDGTTPQ